jgi:hypothetical protein
MRRSRNIVVCTVALLLAGCGSGGGGADDAAAVAATPTELGGPTAAGATADKSEAEITLPADSGTAGPTDAEPPAAGSTDAGPTDAEPSEPVPTGPPTEGLPGGRYVEITDIGTDGQAYAVAFTPYNFTPLIGSGPDDYHVHFFFDTVAPENAGTNGPAPGDWFLYDGPSPFTGYTFADRPPAATQLCVLVADAAHGVTVGTGNCMPLP